MITSASKIDFASLDPARIEPALLRRAQATWQERVQTEYRSAQMMTRLLSDVLSAGDPFEANTTILELIGDELRHVSLCASVVTALGAPVVLPQPLEVQQPPAFLSMTPGQRALAMGITMLVVNETLSVGFIRDLHARCEHPAIGAVLSASLSDESEHDAFGTEFVRRALGQLPPAASEPWRRVATEALRAQRHAAAAVMRELSPEQRRLSAWPDTCEITLGLFSPQRQALVFDQTYRAQLEPRLRDLQLL